jgi:hypothetical protein
MKKALRLKRQMELSPWTPSQPKGAKKTVYYWQCVSQDMVIIGHTGHITCRECTFLAVHNVSHALQTTPQLKNP